MSEWILPACSYWVHRHLATMVCTYNSQWEPVGHLEFIAMIPGLPICQLVSSKALQGWFEAFPYSSIGWAYLSFRHFSPNALFLLCTKKTNRHAEIISIVEENPYAVATMNDTRKKNLLKPYPPNVDSISFHLVHLANKYFIYFAKNTNFAKILLSLKPNHHGLQKRTNWMGGGAYLPPPLYLKNQDR